MTGTLPAILAILDLSAVAVFSVTGALAASRRQMDIFGFALLGVVTGVGGGTVRDLTLGRLPVFWVKDPIYVIVCIIVAAIVFFLAHVLASRIRTLVWLDAIGLSLFAVTGAGIALQSGAAPIVAVVTGVITATFGGIIRDVLAGESPLILSSEIYVTAALTGSAGFVVLLAFNVPNQLAATIGFSLCFIVRALAIIYRWQLPRYRPRPAAKPDDTK